MTDSRTTLALGTVVTCAAADTVIRDGAIAFRDGEILRVGPAAEVRSEHPDADVVGGADSIVIPGMIDCHTHAAQSLVRSLIAAEAPMIYRIYLPVEDAMTLDEVATAVDLLVAQHLRSGITCVAETTATPEHVPVVRSRLAASGMRALLADGAADQRGRHVSVYGQTADRSSAERRAEVDIDDALRRVAAFLDEYPPDGTGLLRGSVIASHLMSASESLTRASAELAAERGARLQMHLARDREEVEFSLAVHGARPGEVLARWGVLSPRLLAVHGILLTDRELAALGAAGAAVAHSPLEALNILNRMPSVARMRAFGVTVGLGCDNALNDPWGTMRGMLQLQSAASGITDFDAETVTPGDALRMMTIDAARALGWDDRVGSLEVGKRADLVVVDGTGPHLFPVVHPTWDLVRYGSRGEVSDVFVDGEPRVRDGALVGVDVDELRARANAAAARLAPVAESRRYRPLPR